MRSSSSRQELRVPAAETAGEAAPRAVSRKRVEVHRADRWFALVLKLSAVGLGFLLLLIAAFLFRAAYPAVAKMGLTLVTGTTWDPVRDVYGALPVIYGTVVSSVVAILFAAPLSIGVALFLTEVAPPRLGRVVGFLIEMLAAIPSVVYGLWGIFVLAPWLRARVEPPLGKALGFLPLFQGPPYGVGMLAASIILAIMITPTVSSISREIFNAIPRAQREAALGLGATRFEMMRIAVLKSSRRGVVGAIILGLGRALGETMAVTMVIGNRHEISASLFAPSATMASIVANEYAEATSDLHVAALAGVGLALFAVTFVINSVARLFISRGFRWGTLGRNGGK